MKESIEGKDIIFDNPDKSKTRELIQQKQRLDYILEGTNVGTWEWNVQTGETIFNERWADIIGYTLDELEPVSEDTWIKFCHPDDLKESEKLLQKCFNKEIDYYHCEVRMRHKNGEWIWVLDRGKVAHWTDDGKPLWMFGTHQDITDNKRAEEALRKSEERHRLFFENAPVAILHYDINGVITDVNDHLFETFSSTREKIIGLGVNDLPNSEFTKSVERTLRENMHIMRVSILPIPAEKKSISNPIGFPLSKMGNSFPGWA